MHRFPTFSVAFLYWMCANVSTWFCCINHLFTLFFQATNDTKNPHRFPFSQLCRAICKKCNFPKFSSTGCSNIMLCALCIVHSSMEMTKTELVPDTSSTEQNERCDPMKQWTPNALKLCNHNRKPSPHFNPHFRSFSFETHVTEYIYVYHHTQRMWNSYRC